MSIPGVWKFSRQVGGQTPAPGGKYSSSSGITPSCGAPWIFADGLWRCLSAQTVSGLVFERGANPYSLERLGSMQVPVCSRILTVSPFISSWHRSLGRFMPRLAKLLEILPFLHFQRLGPQWEWSTATAAGQLDARAQLLPTALRRCRASVSIHQAHIMGTWSCRKPVCHMRSPVPWQMNQQLVSVEGDGLSRRIT